MLLGTLDEPPRARGPNNGRLDSSRPASAREKGGCCLLVFLVVLCFPWIRHHHSILPNVSERLFELTTHPHGRPSSKFTGVDQGGGGSGPSPIFMPNYMFLFVGMYSCFPDRQLHVLHSRHCVVWRRSLASGLSDRSRILISCIALVVSSHRPEFEPKFHAIQTSIPHTSCMVLLMDVYSYFLDPQLHVLHRR